MKSPAIILSLIASTFLTGVIAQPASPSTSSPRSTVSMSRYDGPSVRTDLGFGIVLNRSSSLRREWFVLNDENAPASIQGKTGVSVSYNSGGRGSSGRYEYQLSYDLKSTEPLSAIKIRAHVFDVFGTLIRTLVATNIIDVSGTNSNSDVWRIWSENEASEAFASVVYISAVRTSSGRVYEIDRGAVLEQLRSVSRRISDADLDPKPEPSR